MKIAIYARISTIDKGQDVDLQLKDLRVHAQARGWKIYHEYVDKGQSGGKESRPALDILMDDCRKRKVGVILVWRLDRFGRSLKLTFAVNSGHEIGSHAKDVYHPDSDIDLAIFWDKDEIDGFDEDVLLMKLTRNVDLRIEPHSFARTDFYDTDPYIKEILKTGERIL